jgi:hypothetical protein
MAENGVTGVIEGIGNGVVATSRAETALAALAPEERKRIIQAARNLSGRKPWEWPQAYVISLPGTKPDYYLLTVSPDWRAIVRQTEGGQIEISDVVREETLQLFRERQGSSGAPK